MPHAYQVRLSMRQRLKSKSIGTKLTTAQHQAVESEACAHGLGTSEYVRTILLSQVEGDQEIHWLMAEVVGFRLIMVNLIYSLARNERLTADAMRELLERADNDKAKRVQEILMRHRLLKLETQQEKGLSPATNKGDGR